MQLSGEIRSNALPDTDRSSLKQILNTMPNIGPNGVQSVSRSGPDTQGGYQWTITFDTSLGNIPQLYMYTQSLSGSGATVLIDTIKQGNVLSSGFFKLQYCSSITNAIGFNATATDMQKALEALNSTQSIQVSRSAPDPQNGFKWTIVFLSVETCNLIVSSSQFNAVGAAVQVQEIERTNRLSGSFQLSFNGLTSDDIPYDSDASQFKTALKALNLGDIDVSRTLFPDDQYGFTWKISFLSVRGFDRALDYDASRLIESRLSGASQTLIRVKREHVNSAQEVHQIQISSTGSIVSNTAVYYLEFKASSGGSKAITDASSGKHNDDDNRVYVK